MYTPNWLNNVPHFVFVDISIEIYIDQIEMKVIV